MMPLVWRGMRMADGRPELGRGGNLLGVRMDDLPENEGNVQPGTGGMSVSASPECLPAHRLPRRLFREYPERFPEARGPDILHCWSIGEGAFVAGPLADRLAFRPDPDDPE